MDDSNDAAPRPALSLGERVALREARQRKRAARAEHRFPAATPEQLADEATLDEHPRPTTRAECRDFPRPCPWAGCKHHLYLDVSPDTGSIKINMDREPWELEHTCALDLADERGGMTLEEIAEVLGVTRERVRQLEAMGLRHLRLRRRRLT